MADLPADPQVFRRGMTVMPALDTYKLRVHIRLFSVIVALLSLSLNASAQEIPKKAKTFFNEANYHIGLNQFSEAETKLLLAIKAYPDYSQARLYLADVYYQQGYYEIALEQYHWVRDHGPHPSRVSHFMAKCAFELQQFDKAVEYSEQYLAKEYISKRARIEAELLRNSAVFSKEAIANPLPFSPVNLGDSVNSEDSEYMPAMNADESTVIFTRKIQGQEDLYITGIEEDDWIKSMPIDEGVINTGHNEGAHCISADGKTLLYTICNERFTRGSCDLYFARKTKDGWTSPKNLGPPLNSVSWDSQPTLSNDGNSIYFVSNRSGGYGGFDIYVSHYEDDAWSVPENLGPVINTSRNEQTPFIHFDNETLYFSSNGHTGMGDQDIFFSRKVDGEWTTPVNFGYPINTAAIESGLFVSLDGRTGYFAAERENGFGGLDIYEFKIPEFAKPKRVTYVKARITDETTGKPVDAIYSLKDLTIPTAEWMGSAEDGELLLCLPAGNDYSLHIKGEGYIFESLSFTLRDTITREAHILEIGIQPVESGRKVVLRNIFFEVDSYILLSESDGELVEIIELMEAYPDIRLEISGHTDNTGSREYNMTLSLQRAQSVVDHLVSNGIAADRLIARGYGPDQPISSNSSAVGRAENRRTEFTILQ